MKYRARKLQLIFNYYARGPHFGWLRVYTVYLEFSPVPTLYTIFAKLEPHCTENSKQIFPDTKLRGIYL
jgi:hypothetical protein